MYFSKFIYQKDCKFSKEQQFYIYKLIISYLEEDVTLNEIYKSIKKYDEKNYDELVLLLWEQQNILEELTLDEEVYY